MGSIILGKGINFVYGESVYKILSKSPNNKVKALDLVSNRETIFEFEDFIRLQQLGFIRFILFKLTQEIIHKNTKLLKLPERAVQIAELRYKVLKPLLDNPKMTVNELMGQIYENEDFLNEMREHRFS